MNLTNIRHLCKLLDLGEPMEGTNGWLVLPCPFASRDHAKGTDRKPAFRVHINNEGSSGYHCFACHCHGGMQKLVMELGTLRGENLHHLVALAAAYECDVGFSEFERAVEDEPELLDAALYEAMYPVAWKVREAQNYLLSRGVRKEAAGLAQLRYDPDYRRIMFPVMNGAGDLYGFVGRSVFPFARIPQYTYPPLKKSKHLLGAHLMRTGYPKAVVEGQFAYAHLLEIGAREFCDPVATMGSNMSQAQAGLLIDAGDPVALLYDNDDAGTQGIYGSKTEDGTYKGNGALSLLKGEVMTTVPLYPKGSGGDPDNLTKSQLQEMLFCEDTNP